LVLPFLFSSGAFASQIVSLKVEENRYLTEEQVLKALGLKKGLVYSPDLIYRSVKDGYLKGFFEKISIYRHENRNGVRLLVKVKDLPVVYDIEFVGNKELSDEELRRALGIPKNPEKFIQEQLKGISGPALEEKLKFLRSLPVGRPLTSAEIEKLVEKIKIKYALEGYPNVKVTYRVVPVKGASKLVFYIKEGSPEYVDRIIFRGLKGIDPDELKDVMVLKERSILAFRFHPPFSEQILKDDLKRIEEYLHSKGYLEAKVVGYKIKKIDKEWVDVIIDLEEGPRYEISKVVLRGNTYFGYKELTKEFFRYLKHEGFYYDRELVEFLKKYILNKYKDLGLYATTVEIRTVPNKKTKTVELLVLIHESGPVYNRWTEIRGNYETRDYVIRRELELHEGDLVTRERVKWSKIWLNRLGYFSWVSVRPELLTPEYAKTEVDVKERFTGQFSVGLGYSETTGISGFISVRKGNFLGTGDIIGLTASWGEYARNYSFSYTRKWFLHEPQDLTFSAYNSYNDYDTYNISRKGLSVTLVRRFWHFWRWTVGTDFQSIKYTDVSPDASIYVKEMAQFNSATILRLGVERDTRDSYIFPSSGSYLGVFNRFGGFLGGDEKFEKLTVQGSIYKSDPFFMHGTVFSARAQAGFITPWGGKSVVPIDERFFVGGAYTIRGYRYGYAGPLDPNTGDPIGARKMFVVDLEADYPVKKDLFYVAGFFDFGNGAETWGGLVKDIKAGAGFGIRFITPMAPIKIDFAWKLKKVPGDGSRFRIHLTIGSFF
jgi:outer membrane protein insertion porin family